MEADRFKCHQCGSGVDATALNCPDCGAALAEVIDGALAESDSAGVLEDRTGWKARLLRGAGMRRSAHVTIRTHTETRRAVLGDNGPEAAARICASCGAPAREVSVSLCEFCHAPLTTHSAQPLSVAGAHGHTGPADLEVAVGVVAQQVPESMKASVAAARELMVQPCPACGSRGTWKITRMMKSRNLRGKGVGSSAQASLICATCGHAMAIPVRNDAPPRSGHMP